MQLAEKDQVVVEEEPKVEIVKITNPLYLGVLAPRIQAYSKKLNIQGITYETLYSYFVETVQKWGEIRELWVAYKDNQPVGFAHFFVMGLPHFAKVNMDEFHIWVNDKEVADGFIEKWIEFGKRHNCPLYETSVVNKAVVRYSKLKCEAFGYELTETDRKHFVMRRR